MKTKKAAKTTLPSNAKTSTPSALPLHANSPGLLDIDGVAVRYGDDVALSDVSLCVHRGEFVGLIGPNGAGKTTLLRVMLGLLRPTAGTAHRHQAAKIEYIPQRGNLYNGIVPMSVAEVVALGSGGSSPAADQALDAVHMRQLAHKRFTDLSGGQQQRVTIAKALAGQADVLVLDEPATGIDERSQAMFYELLQSLRQQGMTIIMVSHEVETVLRLVTRVVCLNQTIVYDGAPEHFEPDTYLPGALAQRHVRLHHHHGGGHA